LTNDRIDRDQGIIEPADGRIKTGVRQVARLTDRVAEILDEIEAERKTIEGAKRSGTYLYPGEWKADHKRPDHRRIGTRVARCESKKLSVS
jgi:hypothetical protein